MKTSKNKFSTVGIQHSEGTRNIGPHSMEIQYFTQSRNIELLSVEIQYFEQSRNIERSEIFVAELTEGEIAT